MNKFVCLAIAIMASLTTNAEVPERMAYQVVIRDNNNQLVPDKTISLKISILKDSVNGTIAFVETFAPQTDDVGVARVEIGKNENLGQIDWSIGAYFLKTEIDPTGGTNYTLSGVSPLLSAPTALHSKTAASLSSPPSETDPVYNQSLAAAWADDIPVWRDKINTLENALIRQGLFTVLDIDNNEYPVVLIGEQAWMAENLRTKRLNDGSGIYHVSDNEVLVTASTPNYCWYNNNETTYKNTYGALYNWYAVNTNKLCPTGWHVPSQEEWKTLEMYLGMTQEESAATGWRGTTQGGQLKETGTTLWLSPNTGAIDLFQFGALPGGYRMVNGTFQGLTTNANFWTSTQANIPEANFRDIYYNYNTIYNGINPKYAGLSVRCIRD